MFAMEQIVESQKNKKEVNKMAIIVKMKHANTLVEQIKKKIDSGEITTWTYDIDGDFTYVDAKWINEAWISIKKEVNREDTAYFGIIPRRQKPLSKAVYAVYHGRFAEMLLKFFDNDIDDVTTTAGLVMGIDFNLI